jgi:hypothetical protein
MAKDFRRSLSLAALKGRALAWRFNNIKIEKIKQQQAEQDKMDDMLRDLKAVLRKWHSRHLN